jgi:hypothetical protein
MEDLQELKEKIKEIPKFLQENEDGTYTLLLKKEEKIPDGKIILEEQSGTVIESCQKLSENVGKDMEILLARRSCKEPKLTDEDISTLKGSNYMKLKFATMYVYGLNDFL